MFWRTRLVALKSWRARAGASVGVLALGLAGCATSSETRSTPEAAPASAAPAPAPAEAREVAPKAADKAADADFTTLEEAEAALERARADLNRLALLDPRPGDFAEAPAAAPSPPAAARSSRGAGAASDDERFEKKGGRAAAKPARPAPQESEAAPAKSDNPCETGCKAFASLMRAKAAVCRLDAPGGSRCSRAEDIAREAEGRVRTCGCQP